MKKILFFGGKIDIRHDVNVNISQVSSHNSISALAISTIWIDLLILTGLLKFKDQGGGETRFFNPLFDLK